MTFENGEYRVKGDPLRFIHFSGYGRVAEKCMNDWLPAGPHPFRDLYAAYSEKHEANNKDGISKTVWSYQTYESGEKIDDKLRLEYRGNYDLMFSMENPFALSNAEMARRIGRAPKADSFEVKVNKAMDILKKEGFVVLVKRVWEKVRAKLG